MINVIDYTWGLQYYWNIITRKEGSMPEFVGLYVNKK